MANINVYNGHFTLSFLQFHAFYAMGGELVKPIFWQKILITLFSEGPVKKNFEAIHFIL
jgi:hypothetical protein